MKKKGVDIDTAKACEFFFTSSVNDDGDQVFVCECGTRRKSKKGSGYTNLMSHLNDKHPNWPEIYGNFLLSNPQSAKSTSGSMFFKNPKVIKIYSWLDWVVTNNLPISCVSKKEFREYSKLEGISENTFMKYLRLVEKKIDENLKKELPDTFGLIVDGWTQGTTHYYGVFAAYRKDSKNITRFLTISPAFDETNFTAQNQADFLAELIVEIYGRSISDILFLVADNTNVNPATNHFR